MRRPGRGFAAVAVAVLVTVLTNMPVLLLGALATEITATIRVPAYGVGLAVGVYWAAAALTSACTGVIGRVLSEKGMGIAALLFAVVSLTGSASWISAWPWLIVWACLGGLGNGLGHPSSNYLLVTHIPAASRGLAFGVKQAAVPVTGLVAGVSIPLVALTLGWSMAFLLMAVLGMLVLVPVARTRTMPVVMGATRPAGQWDTQLRSALVLMAAMTMFAGGAVTSAVAFAVIGVLERGIAVGPAGVILAVGSALGAATRIVIGGVVDRGGVSALSLIQTALIVCAVGLSLMAIPITWSYVVGVLLAVGLGGGGQVWCTSSSRTWRLGPPRRPPASSRPARTSAIPSVPCSPGWSLPSVTRHWPGRCSPLWQPSPWSSPSSSGADCGKSTLWNDR